MKRPKRKYTGPLRNWKARKGRNDPWIRKVKIPRLRKKDFKKPLVTFVF